MLLRFLAVARFAELAAILHQVIDRFIHPVEVCVDAGDLGSQFFKTETTRYSGRPEYIMHPMAAFPMGVGNWEDKLKCTSQGLPGHPKGHDS